MGFHKCLYVTLTVLPLVLGIALLTTSLLSQSFYGDLCADRFYISVQKLGIILGSLYFGVVVLGYVSLCSGKKSTGTLYTVVSMLFVILMSGLIIYGTLEKDKVLANTKKCLHESIATYYESKYSHQIIDVIQSKFECCGSTNYHDYPGVLPPSCCETKQECNSLSADLYSTGCYTKFVKRYKNFYPVTMIMFEVITALMVFANISACFVFFGNKKVVYQRV